MKNPPKQHYAGRKGDSSELTMTPMTTLMGALDYILLLDYTQVQSLLCTSYLMYLDWSVSEVIT